MKVEGKPGSDSQKGQKTSGLDNRNGRQISTGAGGRELPDLMADCFRNEWPTFSSGTGSRIAPEYAIVQGYIARRTLLVRGSPDGGMRCGTQPANISLPTVDEPCLRD